MSLTLFSSHIIPSQLRFGSPMRMWHSTQQGLGVDAAGCGRSERARQWCQLQAHDLVEVVVRVVWRVRLAGRAQVPPERVDRVAVGRCARVVHRDRQVGQPVPRQLLGGAVQRERPRVGRARQPGRGGGAARDDAHQHRVTRPRLAATALGLGVGGRRVSDVGVRLRVVLAGDGHVSACHLQLPPCVGLHIKEPRLSGQCGGTTRVDVPPPVQHKALWPRDMIHGGEGVTHAPARV
mmetsp:Transcript_35735/g.90320  ORF Transcript_35735/g.90320 Transcript_35735/m.90320 type:complete len:236 (+) Transcript_35735:75-782(+)